MTLDFFFFLKWEVVHPRNCWTVIGWEELCFNINTVGATVLTANIAQQKYTDVWIENKDLQDKELGISHFKLLQRLRTASSIQNMKAP